MEIDATALASSRVWFKVKPQWHAHDAQAPTRWGTRTGRTEHGILARKKVCSDAGSLLVLRSGEAAHGRGGEGSVEKAGRGLAHGLAIEIIYGSSEAQVPGLIS
jgi:hypothetical protein